MNTNIIYCGDNLEVLPNHVAENSIDLIYIDPPFNSNRVYEVFWGEGVEKRAFRDRFGDAMAYLDWMRPRLHQLYRVLKSNGTFYYHCDWHAGHYVKVLLDGIFGRASFLNEIVWAYDYGARTTKRWAPKHDTILWYARDPKRYTFRGNESDRLPYLAPGLVTPEKRARGKLPTDTWWHTIVSPTGKEKTGYPTQKPLAILERIVKVHSKPGDRLLDFFAGSGSFGDAADRHGRDVVLVDSSAQAIRVMRKRFRGREARFVR